MEGIEMCEITPGHGVLCLCEECTEYYFNIIKGRREMGYDIPSDHGGPLPRDQREDRFATKEELFATKKELQERSTLSGQPSTAREQEAQRIREQLTPMSVKDKVTKHLSDAHKSLMEAHMAAITANPLAGDVPAFQKMQGLAKELSALMLEVNKLRGL